MTMNTPTRRAILGAAPVLALIGVAPAGAMPSTRSDGGRWWRLHARYERAKAAARDYHRTVNDPAYEAYSAEKANVPHHTTTHTYEGMDGGRKTLTTAKESDVRTAMAFTEVPVNGVDDFTETCVELMKLHTERERAVDAIDARLKLTAINEEGDRLDAIEYDLEAQLMELPAPDVKAALWKFDNIRAQDSGGFTASLCLDDLAQAHADIRHFLTQEG